MSRDALFMESAETWDVDRRPALVLGGRRGKLTFYRVGMVATPFAKPLISSLDV
jgi:hypothetical protein